MTIAPTPLHTRRVPHGYLWALATLVIGLIVGGLGSWSARTCSRIPRARPASKDQVSPPRRRVTCHRSAPSSLPGATS